VGAKVYAGGMPKKAIIFDFNRTLYNPESGELYDGVIELLEKLHKEHHLFLLSKQEGGRGEFLRHLGIADYFEAIYFVREKTPDTFAEILSKHSLAPEDCIVIGDRAQGELAAANQAGLDTIWVRQGIFADQMPEGYVPMYTVGSVAALRDLLQMIKK
jgi:FMN phosphatase YigB (HAD superfamily)